MRYLESLPTENTAQEIEMIKRVLANKVPGIDKVLTDDIYLMLRGKLAYNSYPIPVSSAGSDNVVRDGQVSILFDALDLSE
jgi:import receptor subunit TOM20